MADSPTVQRLLAFIQDNNIKTGEDLLAHSEFKPEVPNIDEIDLAGGRLDWSPKKNWVDQNPPGLPKYIEDVAIGIMKSGKTREQAIPIAISRIKKWAAGLEGVNKDTQVKAARALSEWEALKAKAAAKRAARKK